MKWVVFFALCVVANVVAYIQFQDVFNLVAAAAGLILTVWVGKRELFRG